MRTTRGRPREFSLDDALDRALRVFWRDGYVAASVSDLTEAMGVSKPSLYAAFGDKEGLYLRALERYGETQRARHLHVLQAQPDARLAVESFLLSIANAYTDPALPRGCLVVSGTSTCDGAAIPQSVKEALCASMHVSEVALEDRLVRAKRDGALSDAVDVGALATYFNTVVAGIAVLAKGGATRQTLRAVARSAMQVWPPPSSPAATPARSGR